MKFLTKKDLKIPKRGQRKGDNGKVLIIGGSKEYVGAVTLAGMAALRSGCDWVTCACPEKVAWAINCHSPDLVTVKLKGDHLSIKHKKILLRLIDNHDSFLIGNGLTLKAKSLVKSLASHPKCKVIDADAIKSISINDAKNAIITPHKKEFEILLKNSKIKQLKKENLKDIVILKKGNIDEIITKKMRYYNKTGNDMMTIAGTGDVLAGLCAGYLAQGLSLEQSAINAAYMNGYIGDVLKKKTKGKYFFTASDMINVKINK
jgi:NAD(P)H-hydrate epimerase